MKQYTPDPQGLYDKYTVTKQDGTPVEGPTFTLRPYDPHAQKALLVYADDVEKENAQLAADLRKMVEDANAIEECMIAPEWYEIGYEMGLYRDPPETPPHQQHDEEIEVCDGDGHVVAVIVHEYDPGVQGRNYMPNGDPGYPDEPGYSYWRFKRLSEGKE